MDLEMPEYILTDKMRSWAKANGFDPELHLDHFNDYLENKKGKYKSLDAAYRSCVRADWGGLRRQATYAVHHWSQTDAGIEAKARELNISSKGKTRQQLISEIRSAA
jgi:hypothetical protein